jgi:LmbE family N-acetylglucosaminyl deacetylase
MQTNRKKRILVVAAHPDDEVLGCGGTLARHAGEGDAVYALFMTDGVGARGSKDGRSERQELAAKASKVLGMKQTSYHNFPDNAMDCMPLLDVVKVIEKAVHTLKPHIIYTHHAGDLNVDHGVTARAVLASCRPLPDSSVEAIYGFEVLSSTEWAGPAPEGAFCPAHFVSIEKEFGAKMKALRAYAAEMREFPHARSYEAVEALTTLRGTQVGVKKAEAFSVMRTIRK